MSKSDFSKMPLPFATRRLLPGHRSAALLLPLALLLSACASVPLKQGGTLSSYDRLGEQTGQAGKYRTYVNTPAVTSARTVRILPATLTPEAASAITKPEDRALVSNALDRALCVALSDRYEITGPDQPADLTLRNVVTGIVPTNRTIAGASVAVSAGSSFVLPVSVPRLPIGLGGLAVEGEALDAEGNQQAAILWSKGANSITSSPMVSQVGDAYGLAAAYGSDFSQLMIKGKSPSSFSLSLPSGQKIKSFFGGKPKYAACDTFGRQPGIAGLVATRVGAPPQWTDKGSRTPAPAATAAATASPQASPATNSAANSAASPEVRPAN